ncbi:hypothetical protein [Sphingomonas sp. 2378]|uniref:hypothetical protein n=1 Tax=Sphingomonas sp. 2378 TaxID=1219748 RepID=UPI00311B1069
MTQNFGLAAQAARLLATAPCPSYRDPGETMARIAASRAREADRVHRLVLGKPRVMPRIDTTGLNRQERKALRNAAARAHEQRLKEDRRFTGKEATPETLRDVAHRTEGSLARLFSAGHIDKDQLAAAEAIYAAHRIVVGDVAIAIASIEARVDRSPRGPAMFYEALGAVQAEVAYTNWRASLPKPAAVLDMIVGGVAFTVAAARYGMAHRRAKTLLIEALDAWPRYRAQARKEIGPATLAAAHAGIL